MGKRASGHVTEEKTARTAGGGGLDDRTCLVKRVVGICQLVKIVRQNVWTQFLKHDRDGLGVLEKFEAQSSFGWLVEQDRSGGIGGLFGSAEDRADADIGVLKVGGCVSFER